MQWTHLPKHKLCNRWHKFVFDVGCKKHIIVLVLFPANQTIKTILNVQLNWRAGQFKSIIWYFVQSQQKNLLSSLGSRPQKFVFINVNSLLTKVAFRFPKSVIYSYSQSPWKAIQNSTINSISVPNTIPLKCKVLFMFQTLSGGNQTEDKAHQSPSNYFLERQYHLFLSGLCCTSSTPAPTAVSKLICLLTRHVEGLAFFVDSYCQSLSSWWNDLYIKCCTSVISMITSNESL